jgi:hypothetical protein
MVPPNDLVLRLDGHLERRLVMSEGMRSKSLPDEHGQCLLEASLRCGTKPASAMVLGAACCPLVGLEASSGRPRAAGKPVITFGFAGTIGRWRTLTLTPKMCRS